MLTQFGNVLKNILCPCLKDGYSHKKKISSMTARKYREGLSTRLMVAKETLTSRQRQKLPILIINLNGVTGYLDESRIYHIKLSVI